MKKWCARWVLRLLGWRVAGERSTHEQYVLIAAPHTSNWDFPMMLLFAAAFEIKLTWMGKHNLFYPPMGWVMRATGGMPIERHKNRNVVDARVEVFKENSTLVLAVPAEGTRAHADYWKSGFYHIARKAGVPIVPSFLDYGKKRGGFGPALCTSDDVVQDMQTLRDFYAEMEGKFPQNSGPILLREESEKAAP